MFRALPLMYESCNQEVRMYGLFPHKVSALLIGTTDVTIGRFLTPKCPFSLGRSIKGHGIPYKLVFKFPDFSNHRVKEGGPLTPLVFERGCGRAFY